MSDWTLVNSVSVGFLETSKEQKNPNITPFHFGG